MPEGGAGRGADEPLRVLALVGRHPDLGAVGRRDGEPDGQAGRVVGDVAVGKAGQRRDVARAGPAEVGPGQAVPGAVGEDDGRAGRPAPGVVDGMEVGFRTRHRRAHAPHLEAGQGDPVAQRAEGEEPGIGGGEEAVERGGVVGRYRPAAAAGHEGDDRPGRRRRSVAARGQGGDQRLRRAGRRRRRRGACRRRGALTRPVRRRRARRQHQGEQHRHRRPPPEASLPLSADGRHANPSAGAAAVAPRPGQRMKRGGRFSRRAATPSA